MGRQDGDEGGEGEGDVEREEDVVAAEHIFQPDLGPGNNNTTYLADNQLLSDPWMASWMDIPTKDSPNLLH